MKILNARIRTFRVYKCIFHKRLVLHINSSPSYYAMSCLQYYNIKLPIDRYVKLYRYKRIIWDHTTDGFAVRQRGALCDWMRDLLQPALNVVLWTYRYLLWYLEKKAVVKSLWKKNIGIPAIWMSFFSLMIHAYNSNAVKYEMIIYFCLNVNFDSSH